MSHIDKALDGVKLAAVELGGVNALAQRAGVNVDTARRMVRAPPSSIKILRAMEAVAEEVLGGRMP